MNTHLLLKNNNSYKILKNSEINIKVKKKLKYFETLVYNIK